MVIPYRNLLITAYLPGEAASAVLENKAEAFLVEGSADF
jgi:hypothetical protein